jgi:hypothetical protein
MNPVQRRAGIEPGSARTKPLLDDLLNDDANG